jgi:hypothetical protein
VVDPRRKSSYRSRRRHTRRRGGVRARDSESDSSSGSEYDNDDLEDGYSKPALFETKGPLSAFRSIDPKEKEHLTPQHYFLFPRRMDGFSLAQKERSNSILSGVTEIH